MAKVAKNPPPWRGTGHRTTYDWPSWCDGRVWQIMPEDMPHGFPTFAHSAYNYAKNHGFRIRINRQDDGSCFMQAYNLTNRHAPPDGWR